MLFINKLFNSIACLLYFISLQLVIPGRTRILLYLGRTVYKRLWACLALYMFIGINPFALHVSLGLKNHPYFCEQLMKLPPEKRSMASINLESVHIPKDSKSQGIFPDIFCSAPDSRFHVPHKIWRYGFLYSNTVGFTKMQI